MNSRRSLSICAPVGASLVLVLAALALVSFLALAIMNFIRTEDRSARTSADLVERRVLSELPEKLVIAQLRRATTDLGTSLTWTSQPGMVRVFDTTAPSSSGEPTKPFEIYKLYSATKMVVPGDADLEEDTKALSEWVKAKATFVDLNEPVRVMPPRKQGGIASNDPPAVIFPILDKRAKDLVDGFDYGAPPGATGSVSDRTDVTSEHPLPMPVSWLYVLRDGTVAAPVTSSETTVTVKEATEDNPIVGRIAFWADDESCKLNINTATEPSPWLAPLARTVGDEANAQAIPAKHEFYRTSGHPSFTSLVPALRHLGQTGSLDAPPKYEPEDGLNHGIPWWDHLAAWHDLMPRTFEQQAITGTEGGARGATDEVSLKESRWFANVDELFFTPGTASSRGRSLWSGTGDAPKPTQEDLRAVEGVLTVHSRAPELNPFNRPKISLWPVHKDTTERNKIDKAFVDASSLGADIYCLQREANYGDSAMPLGSGQDADADMNLTRNREIFGYLQELTERPIPGFGGQFVGTGGKYSSESRDQLLMSMFDMIRWGMNPVTPYQDKSRTPVDAEYSYLIPGDGTAEGAWSAVPMRLSGNANAPKGFGRFPTITQLTLVFAATDAAQIANKLKDDDQDGFGDETKAIQVFVVINPFNVAPGVPGIEPHYVYRIEGLGDLKINGHSAGLPGDAASEVRYPSTIKLPSNLTYGGNAAPHGGFAGQFLQPDGKVRGFGTALMDLEYPFFSNQPVALPLGQGTKEKTLELSGLGNVRVSIYDASTAYTPAKIPVQVLNFDLSVLNTSANSVKLPMPLVSVLHAPQVLNVSPTMQLQSRFTPVKSFDEGPQMLNLIHGGDGANSGDVTCSFELRGPPSQGDVRLIAGLAEVPAIYFKLHPQLPGLRGDSLRDGAHMLDGQVGSVQIPALSKEEISNSSVSPPTIATSSPLVVREQSPGSGTFNALLHDRRSVPAMAWEIMPPPGTLGRFGALNADDRPGDFDNGPGIIEDGPYINAPGIASVANQIEVMKNGDYGGWFRRGGLFGEEDGISFSPAGLASSGFLFGSLPTGLFGKAADTILTPAPWQTLLLCPNPSSRTTVASAQPDWQPGSGGLKDHFGFMNPRDHLWLEFFWLPTIEPKGLCDGLATEGKVNMNCQLFPFTWVKRETALYGALHGVRVTAIPSAAVTTAGPDHYKNPGGTSSLSFRYAVDAKETMKGFNKRFDVFDVFRSPSEICDLFLVPKRIEDGRHYDSGTVHPVPTPLPYDDMMKWWEGPNPADPSDGFEATGDNARESPYAQLYPRLCTRSNVFTVHWRVQVLRKSRSTDSRQWSEDEDRVVSEQRGQTVVERFLPPNVEANQPITDFVKQMDDTEALDDFYEYRIVSRRGFAP